MACMLQFQDQLRNTKKVHPRFMNIVTTLKLLSMFSWCWIHYLWSWTWYANALWSLTSYQSIVDVITNTNLFSSFMEAKNMLLLHWNCDENHDPMLDSKNNNTTALYSVSHTNPKNQKINGIKTILIIGIHLGVLLVFLLILTDL